MSKSKALLYGFPKCKRNVHCLTSGESLLKEFTNNRVWRGKEFTPQCLQPLVCCKWEWGSKELTFTTSQGTLWLVFTRNRSWREWVISRPTGFARCSTNTALIEYFPWIMSLRPPIWNWPAFTHCLFIGWWLQGIYFLLKISSKQLFKLQANYKITLNYFIWNLCGH